MKATNIGELKEKLSFSGEPSCRIDINDFAHLFVSINRWDKFLDTVFMAPVNGTLTDEVLEELALEDSQYYLDLQIQLSHCLVAARDPELREKFEGICRQIKKDTYHLISTTLRNLADNKRELIEFKTSDDNTGFHRAVSSVEWPGSADLGVGVEYKNHLLEQRKQLKSDMIGQKSLVTSQIIRLKKELRSAFYTAPK